MKTIRSSLACSTFLAFLPLATAAAVRLEHSLYLKCPWGAGQGQIAQYLPHPGEDASIAGPVAFAISPKGDVAIADIQASRVQIFDRTGAFQTVIAYKKENPDLIQDVAFDDQGRLALVGSFGPVAPKQKQLLRIYDAKRQWVKDIDLLTKGIRAAEEVEWTRDGNILIQDNATFKTSEISLEGQILESVPEDEDLSWLCSKGEYLFKVAHSMVKIFNKHGGFVAEYPDDNAVFHVIGVNSRGLLYVVSKATSGALILEGLSPDGQKTFSIPLTEARDKQLFEPSRLHEIRNAIVGPDGAVYVMNEPSEKDFEIERYQISN